MEDALLIRLTGKPGDAICKIQFTPRPAFRDNPRVHEIEKTLVYGHVCPTCGNVIQACFLTDEPVNLWAYEETNFISKSSDEKKFGTILKVVPNVDSKYGYSQYTSTVFRTSGGKAQHLTLKNHIVKYHGANTETQTTDRYFEPGGCTCEYVGVFSLREDLALKDLCLLWRFKESYKNLDTDYEFTTIASVAEGFESESGQRLNGLQQYGVRPLPAYGQAPPVLLFSQEKLKANYPPWYQISTLMNSAFYKERKTA